MSESDIMISDDTVDFDEYSIVEVDKTLLTPVLESLFITLYMGSSVYNGKLIFSTTYNNGSGLIRASFDLSLYSELSKGSVCTPMYYHITDSQNNAISTRDISNLRSWSYYAENNEFELYF